MAVIVGFTGDNPLLQGTTDADEIFGNSSGTLNGIGGNDRIFGLAGRGRHRRRRKCHRTERPGRERRHPRRRR